mgnify:CR=1 FL=1
MKSFPRIIQLLISLLAVIFSVQNSHAQLYYSSADSVLVKENGDYFDFPFQGGFNAPQFNAIDLNYDNIMDLVIYERSGGKVYTYLNGGTANQVDYTYAPQYEGAFPEVSDWMFARDYNCDGQMDLITGVRGSSVRVYENVGSLANGLSFTYVGVIQSLYPNGSVPLPINPGGANLPGIVDMNNDGDMDLIFFDSNGSQMQLHKNLSVERTGICGLDFEVRSECWGDFTEAGFNSTVYLDSCRFGDRVPNPESDKGGSVRNLDIQKTTSGSRISKHAGSSVSPIDLGTIGGMDLVIGDIGGNNLTALYNDDSIAPFINSHITSLDSTFPVYNTPVDLPVFPAAFFLDVNNDQKEDMIVTTNSNGYLARSYYNNNVLYYENVGSSQHVFNYRQNNFLQGEVIDLGRGAYPAFFDYNNDGLMDMLVGNDGYLDTASNEMIGQLALFQNIGTPTMPEFDLIDRDFGGLSNIPLDLSTNAPQRYLIPALGDLDGDGDMDLLIGDDDGRVHYFIDSSSTGNSAAFELSEASFQGLNVFDQAAPALIDINQDNLLDLVIGNALGILEYHQNLGNSSTPIFNLEVQSIIWQYDSIIRYQLRDDPNLSVFSPGDTLDINEALFGDNNVFQIVAAVNDAQNYLDLIHPFRRNALDDEATSTAVIDYSEKNWGGVRLPNYFNGDRNAAPFLYRNNQNELNMIIGSQKGYLYFFNQIDSNLTGNFNLYDSTYTGRNYGASAAVYGADLNQDTNIDLAVGNEAGGLQLLFGSTSTSLVDLGKSGTDKELPIKLFPNPTKGLVNLLIEEEIRGTYDLRIYDLSGKKVWEERGLNQRSYQFIPNLKPALYMVEVAGDEMRSTTKLLIKP